MIHLPQNSEISYLTKEIFTSKPLKPYDPIVCDFLNELSIKLRNSPSSAEYPDMMAVAFWCRKAHLNQLQTLLDPKEYRLGLGTVFHIAPSNVPVNFAFSYLFGLLAGNSNIVRVPSKNFPQIDIIIDAINELLEREPFESLKSKTHFVRYERNDEITAAFSKACHARVIWGGDQTIENIRKSPLPVRSQEIVFSDRYSISMIDSNAILALEDTALLRLVENFYNDTYLMDQNACSSPHLILWLGENSEAKEKFWQVLALFAAGKYQIEPVNVVDKYTQLCQQAIDEDNIKTFKQYNHCLHCLTLDHLFEDVDRLRGKCGYFYQFDLDNINQISEIVNTKYQTLTYFGIDKDALVNSVIEQGLLGIDRIVPIGKAMDIDVIWDGYDIIRSLSRIINVK